MGFSRQRPRVQGTHMHTQVCALDTDGQQPLHPFGVLLLALHEDPSARETGRWALLPTAAARETRSSEDGVASSPTCPGSDALHKG